MTSPYRPTTTRDDIAANLETIRGRIATACQQAGRAPDEVRLLPISKTIDEARIRDAYALGCDTFGENKVQEALQKSEAMADLDARWALVGHLQTNKVNHALRFADEFHALDRVKLAVALDKRLQALGRSLDVFIQVNSSGEDSKFGLAPDDVLAFAKELAPMSALRVVGLMTLARFSPDADVVRPCFETMQALQDKLRQSGETPGSYDELSMGMSGDFELAIAHGATVVRVGQAIFGPRATSDAHYWPGTAPSG